MDTIKTAQDILNGFTHWFSVKKLYLNIEKTSFIHFKVKQQQLPDNCLLRINGESVMQVRTTNFLGILIDEQLKWDIHVINLCKTLSSVCYAVYRLRLITNKNIAMSYYYANFYSRIAYSIIFWGSSSQNSKKSCMYDIWLV